MWKDKFSPLYMNRTVRKGEERDLSCHSDYYYLLKVSAPPACTVCVGLSEI